MARDPANQLLLKLLQQTVTPSLVIADEQLAIEETWPTGPQIHYLSNRFDIAQALHSSGAQVTFSDFNFSDFAQQQFQHVLFRIAKEKSLVHHIIAHSRSLLAPNGSLCLIGHKNEGLKTYTQKANGLLGGELTRHRGDKGYYANCLNRGDQLTPPPESDYASPRLSIQEGILAFFSKPGIYGWQKIDRGSQLLIEALRQDLEDRPKSASQSLLDLGCGYGYLSVKAGQFINPRIVATDNNCAAVAMCRKNLEYHRLEGEVLADDCGEQIQEAFDLVLCNPPFHQGFKTRRDLTERFLESAARHTNFGGAAYFVVNEFIDLGARAAPYFKEQTQLANQDGFRIFRLASPA